MELQTQTKKPKKSIKPSVGKCGVCGKMVSVLYWNREKGLWECENCHWKEKKEKEDIQ